ncbi:MAG TPA: endonuclease III [Clostridiaceae bacterium]|jgi:endonuclease-3|nr:endonuclease III [Clostridiaceae bacterium]
MTKRQRVIEIIKIFDRLYPEAGCSLEYKDPLQLLVAAQLSAQCTDARVNIVTKTLFQKYKNVYDFAEADLEELQEDIRSTGFYRNKAKNIKNCCRMIIDEFGGMIPDNMDDMLKLPGVGRKTANLILGDIFGIPGIVVDTHAKRLANRMGLTDNDNPEKIEYDLMKIVPKAEWTRFCHQLVLHGRAVCTARNPKCDKCLVNEFCPNKL